MKRSPRLAVWYWCLVWCLSASSLSAQVPYTPVPYEDREAPSGDGLYGSSGLGFLSLDRGAGFNLPLGATVVSSRFRLVATLNLLDIGLLQKSDPDSRYTRFVDTFGRTVCVDTETNFRVSSFNCSGESDLLRSASADVGFIPIQTDFFAGKPGKFFVGGGFRLRRPRTAYGSLGMLFPNYSGTVGGLKVMAGSDFVLVEATWGIHINRMLGRD